ncbi:DUF2007 domain-containing protein [Thalassotalea ponticola]|uniref:putative signal transducing protein n=1 Tax=Thalassotalea ponticola TaxID=1523392 RepID=UPI0025B3EE7C|nr:DUF2007 domain-containing protein [Thalassotalea ponticola]MDN3651207.1 DUF2007 domain-containing protein [Thalassotalea ponticola]
MICVFDASNTIQAHLVANLLEQAEIKAYIHGEHLQGGVGELQAVGLVRVLVDNANEQLARELIDHWELS